MNLTQMHVIFRQFAQQMGMQNVRAILPEQIDLLINTSISDTVNRIVQINIGITNDRVVTDNSKVGQVNSLRTLYKAIDVEAFNFTSTVINKYSTKLSCNIDDIDIDPLYLVDFSIDYKNNDFQTSLFPIRLIDEIFLADVLNDFVLKPRFISPIITIVNNNLDIYLGEPEPSLNPNIIRISYIAKPVKVKYNLDTGGKNVDSDMPEHLHEDIVKHAVELWQAAIANSIVSENNRQRQNQYENVRNTNRNEYN